MNNYQIQVSVSQHVGYTFTATAKHKYILVVLGDDPSFFQDKKLFPEMSRIVYKAMTVNTSSSMSDSDRSSAGVKVY